MQAVPLCAGCGCELEPGCDESLCPACEEKIMAADTAWRPVDDESGRSG